MLNIGGLFFLLHCGCPLSCLYCLYRRFKGNELDVDMEYDHDGGLDVSGVWAMGLDAPTSNIGQHAARHQLIDHPNACIWAPGMTQKHCV